METLIELYDERAIENILGPEIFKPGKIIYICPPDVVKDTRKQEVLKDFFASRGYSFTIEFVESSLYKADKIYEQLLAIAEKHPDCALDVTGGTDAALIASGMFCLKTGLPTFTYSRRQNRFYDISNAPFADEKPCLIHYKVEDFFKMAGGRLRRGRVDNEQIKSYTKDLDVFFEIFLRYRREWPEVITFFQRISKSEKGEKPCLKVKGSLEQKGDHGSRVRGNIWLLKALSSIGYIKELDITDDEVSFTFKDEIVRGWLRDVGSALELYMYKICRESGIFEDVYSSAVVDWDDKTGRENVSNEIDVVAARGVTPIFISCKACDVRTEALNELAILRDRFGGKGAKAVIVTTELVNAAARHRASQLGIAVIDLEEIESGAVAERLKVIMKLKNDF